MARLRKTGGYRSPSDYKSLYAALWMVRRDPQWSTEIDSLFNKLGCPVNLSETGNMDFFDGLDAGFTCPTPVTLESDEIEVLSSFVDCIFSDKRVILGIEVAKENIEQVHKDLMLEPNKYLWPFVVFPSNFIHRRIVEALGQLLYRCPKLVTKEGMLDLDKMRKGFLLREKVLYSYDVELRKHFDFLKSLGFVFYQDKFYLKSK